MSGISNHIERFLKTLLDESEGEIEIGRNDLAEKFGCAPSQINYVLSTRFTPYKGYFIESRRGGSGYIRIVKLAYDASHSPVTLIREAIGESVTKNKAAFIIEGLKEEGLVTDREALIMLHVLEDTTLTSVPQEYRNCLRSELLKSMLVVLLR